MPVFLGNRCLLLASRGADGGGVGCNFLTCGVTILRRFAGRWYAISPIFGYGHLLALQMPKYERKTMKYLVAWLLGVPGIVVVLWFLFSHH